MRTANGASAFRPANRAAARSGEQLIDLDQHERITPVVRAPQWLRDFGYEEQPEPTGSPATSANEINPQLFWNPPSSSASVTSQPLPNAEVPGPSRARRWGAKLLFVTVLGCACALLAMAAVRVVSGRVQAHSVWLK